jgi:two-component system response regulator AtoC
VSYPWPGNVRELENALTRAVVLAKGEVLEVELLPIGRSPPGGQRDAGATAAAASAVAGEADILPLREVERRHIEKALRATGWNKRRACALLDISRPTLDRKIEEFGLEKPAG